MCVTPRWRGADGAFLFSAIGHPEFAASLTEFVYSSGYPVLSRMRMFPALVFNPGTSQQNSNVAAIAPANCAVANVGTSTGRIPVNVSESDRAIVTAGFANDVDEVNQYAAVMYAATAKATMSER